MLAGVSGQHRQLLYAGCKWSRMLPLVLSPAFWSTSTMTPVLHSLHWLPIRQRITFKTAVIVFKCLHGQAPPYLIELCRPTSLNVGHRPLRSACTHRLVVPRTKTSYGDCGFSVHGPSVWNSLPNDLRSTDMSIETFRARLKAFLFGHWLQTICCFLRIWDTNGITHSHGSARVL